MILLGVRSIYESRKKRGDIRISHRHRRAPCLTNFGYTDKAFAQQQMQLISMGMDVVANDQGLIYPFFVIEFNGDSALWVATNQCLGASASCVNIAERLNDRLKQSNSEIIWSIENAAFSVAINGTEARLYIPWKHDELDYHTRKVDSFLLQNPKDYLEFRKYVLTSLTGGGTIA